MNVYFRSVKRSKPFVALVIALMPFFVQGCGRDRDTKVVDFSKTVQIERTAEHRPKGRLLRVAVAAMTSPKENFVCYRRLLSYMGRHLGMKVRLIQRKSYGEINKLLAEDRIDLAFICSGPYATGKDKYGFQLLAVPRIRGSSFYQAYLIVNRKSPFHNLEDLRGRVFAFTDPDSNTGRLVPVYWLSRIQERPETFFRKTIFTYGHDNSIQAVARGLVDGAAVDGLIWEYYQRTDPVFTSKTRIIKKSEPFGNPPLVVNVSLRPELKNKIRHLLFSMQKDPEGQKILKELMIDRYVKPKDEWYEPIRRMEKRVELFQEKTSAPEKP